MSNANDTTTTDTDVRPVDVLPVVATTEPVEGAVIMDGYPLDYNSELFMPRPMSGRELFFSRLKYGYYMRQAKYWLQDRWAEFTRKLPRVVFYGDEIDVLVTFTKDKYPQLALPTSADKLTDYIQASDALNVQVQHAPDAIAKATAALEEAGIDFNFFADERGRHWTFDDSLYGPMRVKFIGKAKAPLARTE